jgi:hypothetical protein
MTAEERVILFVVATGIDHSAIGIVANSMRRMMIRGLIDRSGAAGKYALTAAGREALAVLLEGAGFKYVPSPGSDKAAQEHWLRTDCCRGASRNPRAPQPKARGRPLSSLLTTGASSLRDLDRMRCVTYCRLLRSGRNRLPIYRGSMTDIVARCALPCWRPLI